MKVAIIGTGYVGLVAGTCFADLGNDVVCLDVDAGKIDMLRRGESPIYEPGLSELIVKNTKEKRLRFSTDIAAGIQWAKYIFVAVGTPSNKRGEADMQYVWAVARSIGRHMNGAKIIVDKSTVPIGTGDKVSALIAAELRKRKKQYPYVVVSNPEFLREGCAIKDFMEPDRVVIGADKAKAAAEVARLYQPLHAKVILTDLRSAEMIKYAANAFLSVKISFVNNIACLCEAMDEDIKAITEKIGNDHRINPHFLHSGIGYGGSCFPKDVDALEKLMQEHGVDAGILESARRINRGQRTRFVATVKQAMPKLRGKKIGVLGLAFKANTDDMREAPALDIIPPLLRAGAKVCAYDPVAMKNSAALLPAGVRFCDSVWDAVTGADAVLLLTEWNDFKELNFATLRRRMRGRLLFDGRNLYDPAAARRAGFVYHGIGRNGRTE